MPILCLLTAGCDPYSGQRPFELGAAAWTCQEGDDVFRFDSDPEKEYPAQIDGEFVRGDESVYCRFVFIGQTNRLFIERLPDKYATREHALAVLDGHCDFSPDSFVMHIDKTEGDFFEGVGDELTFIRTDPAASELANTSDSAA